MHVIWKNIDNDNELLEKENRWVKIKFEDILQEHIISELHHQETSY
jgi:hypothetical protein